MGLIRAVRTGVVLASLLVGTSCGSATPAARVAQGSLTLSGAITRTVTAGTQKAGTGCSIVDISTGLASPPPADLELTGTVDFSAGSTDVALKFLGGVGTFKLPLAGELQSPGPPGSVAIVAANSETWAAGQDSPMSSGTITLSKTTTGTIHGSVDANLAALRADDPTPPHRGHMELLEPSAS